MPQRPVVTGLLAVGLTAAAMHVATSPTPSVSHLSDAAYSIGSRPATTQTETPFGDLSWSEQLKINPETAGKLTAQKELQETICDFVSLPAQTCSPPPVPPPLSNPPPSNPPAANTSGASAPTRPMYTNMDTKTPEVMLAIVPDPIHTHLALMFDREIDALEDALADTGWQYQNHWMPWSAGPAATDTKFTSREQERLFVSGQEQYPGVLLFRPSAALEKPLIIFVVGDTPTSGINQPQFREAIQRFRQLAPDQTSLKVLGPSFTGAGPSLHALLAELKTSSLKSVSVQFASGFISDWNCNDFLPRPRNSQDPDHHPVPCVDQEDMPDAFVSFGPDFRWETQQIESYLHDQGHLKYKEIAQLAEDESGFGALGTIRSKDTTGPNVNTHPNDDQVLKLTFPRNISHLRSAYQKNGIWGFGGTTSGANSISLSLDFDEPHESDDAVPTFAKQQMPVSQEGSMGQIATILEQHNINAVLLSATDVLDELFVAQLLARQAPNVVVIIRGTDVLFLRSADGGVYHNMYAVSPWPLIPRNAHWSRTLTPGETPHTASEYMTRAFPSDYAEGYYTAAKYLLHNDKEENLDPDALQHLQDYSSPITASTQPPLWFSAIGHGAYWPIALLPDVVQTSPPQTPPPVSRSLLNLPPIPQAGDPIGPDIAPSSLSHHLLLFIACLLSLLHVAKCFDRPALRGFGVRYRIDEKQTRQPKLWLQLGITLLGALMLSLMYGPPRGPAKLIDVVWALTLACTAFALSLAASRICGMLLRDRLQQLPERSMWRKLKPLQALLLASVPFFAAACLLWFAMWSLLPDSNSSFEGVKQFFFYRSNFSLSGTSPVFPLLIALNGLTLFLLSQLTRLSFGPSLAPRLPDNVQSIPNCPSQSSMEPLNSLLAFPPGKKARARKITDLVIVALSTLVVAEITELAPRTLEGTTLTFALRITMYLVLIAVLWDLTMASLLWRRLKDHCLDPLESSPLRRGFSAISGLTWKTLWLMPQSGFVQYRALIRALEQTTHAVMDTDEDELLRQQAAAMWNEIQQYPPARPDKIVADFGEVQRSIAKAAEAILSKLKQAWQGEVERITAPDEHQANETEVNPVDAAAKAAEAVLRKLQASWQGDKNHTLANSQTVPDPDAVKQIREEWLALVYIHYVRMVLIQIRSRLVTAAMLYLILVWSVTSYPYLNRHILMIGLTALIGLLAAVTISTYASINRDAILSRTTEHIPGKLDLDFYVKTASIVGIPLLGFIASQFPEVSSFLFSWIEPGMAAVK